MNVNENVKLKTKTTAAGATELLEFESMNEFLEFAAANDLGDYLESLEEIPTEDFDRERRRRKAEWAALTRDKRKLIRIGEIVRQRLILLGLSQSQLARKMGIHRSWVTRVVQGKENLTIATLCQLAESLDCEEADLFHEPAMPKPALVSPETAKYEERLTYTSKHLEMIRSRMRGGSSPSAHLSTGHDVTFSQGMSECSYLWIAESGTVGKMPLMNGNNGRH